MTNGGPGRILRWGVLGGGLAVILAAWSAPAPAQTLSADPGFESPPAAPGAPGVVEPVAPPQPIVRPRFSVAVGMGSIFDSAGFPDGRHAIPAFFALGGAGDGWFGVDFLVFASSASGRFFGDAENPVDRLAMDGFSVWRPAGRFRPGDRGYGMRVLRTIGAEVGVGVERDGRRDSSGSRFTIHTGARIELPLTPVAESSELRLRLAVRRDFGLFTPNLGTAGALTPVGETPLDVYAALALVF